MKYYIVEESIDRKIVGNDYPQAYKFVKGYDPDAPYAIFSLYKYHTSFPDYIPDLNGIRLSGSAKLTDFISNGFSGRLFIISEKVKYVFEQYNLCTHRFYPLGLYERKIKHSYFLLSIISDYSNSVNYEKSSFVEYNIADEKGYGAIKINSRNELIKLNDKLEKEKGTVWCIWSVEIIMGKDFDKNLDFFRISKFDSNTYVSERLMNAIIESGLTGWEFKPATNLTVE